ncbi:dTDP-4-dehydrorhamnose 3,5-epimerase [Paenibacillus qinlingensis]|uniref:dTDP-4-dehydrorhamnose 3,5-epimerase n=1 Tax=Paenibacillus qinlingensis TaxID=1837343 RepID=A0ABU1NY43_9BACL|nr:dTDP-4-dehydrorhamnose 3,5-epimerase [Paenibacillus qinlingensis]MDR6552209.1 dTDP-4-dehydrorhamnose 3,5-epimerase [Paenibacillus qinlingensis]
MKVIKTSFSDVFIIEPTCFVDHRGFFMESYNLKVFSENNITNNFVQDNQSLSIEAGVIRGLHYQLSPKAQSKLVRVVSGAIYDVVVDIRRGSSSFGKAQGFILSEYNQRQLFIPKGFAHGFCTLVANTQVSYKVDEYYCPTNDRGILWNDPSLNIDWPISSPILSDKDKLHPTLEEADINF